MQKTKQIRKGSSDFKTIIEDNGYFVDKTMLIKEFYFYEKLSGKKPTSLKEFVKREEKLFN